MRKGVKHIKTFEKRTFIFGAIFYLFSSPSSIHEIRNDPYNVKVSDLLIPEIY
jgi:hypothetical protein